MRRVDVGQYKSVERDGVTVVIINNGRLLVLKRRAIPFIVDPGEWEFVSGSRKKGESHDQAAYREVLEETGIHKGRLTLMARRARTAKTDVKKKVRFTNTLYVFLSGTDQVKLNIENSRYRWATYEDVSQHRNYANVFLSERSILRLIRSALDEEAAEEKDR